jgi:predicted transporter
VLVVAAVLFVVWAFEFFAFHVGGSLIHILLVAAVVSLGLHFVREWP